MNQCRNTRLAAPSLAKGIPASAPRPLATPPAQRSSRGGSRAPNNSLEPPPLRSGDLRPIPASRVFGFGAILALAGRAAHLEAVSQPEVVMLRSRLIYL